MLHLENIKAIYKNSDKLKGYYIEFNDGKKIHLIQYKVN